MSDSPTQAGDSTTHQSTAYPWVVRGGWPPRMVGSYATQGEADAVAERFNETDPGGQYRARREAGDDA